ncbi:MAG: phytanoyl-CoA dioxygenase family protein [Chloracidobacterium sp.]|nr:phytanoyl-CoA dioxygenase family protein [Chloracidobacterium sp.]
MHREDLGSCRLSEEDLLDYEANGFLVVEDWFSETTLDELKAESLRLVSGDSLASSAPPVTERASDSIRTVYGIHKSSSLFARVSSDPSFVDLANCILNSDTYIHQSRINFKSGFSGKEFFWHSDFETWHVEDGMPAMRCLSIMIALDDNTAVNGPLLVIPGSHREFYPCVGTTPEDHFKTSLMGSRLGSPLEHQITQVAQKQGIVPVLCRKGSIVVFDCNVLHASNNNISPFERTNAFIVYNSIENRLQDPYCGRNQRPEWLASRIGTERPAPYVSEEIGSNNPI